MPAFQPDYSLRPDVRAVNRSQKIAAARDAAETTARRLFSSIKCGTRPDQHAGDPDGCANDGTQCLCECHDNQERAALDG